MPLHSPRQGTYDDVKMLIDSYDWRRNVRLNNTPIIPTVYQWTELGNRRSVADPCIVVQVHVIRGIELSAGIVALRARMGITLTSYGKTPQICEKMADAMWNLLFATNDVNGTRNYSSTTMTTLRKIIPVGYNDKPARKEYDDRGQATGWWVHIVQCEAETQQAN